MNQELRIKNILKIDTSNNLKTRIELNSKVFEEERGSPSEQNVLIMIEKILIDKKIKIEDINSIEIQTGPGSFTGLRVGAAIANALSFSGLIEVNGQKLGEIVMPSY